MHMQRDSVGKKYYDISIAYTLKKTLANFLNKTWSIKQGRRRNTYGLHYIWKLKFGLGFALMALLLIINSLFLKKKRDIQRRKSPHSSTPSYCEQVTTNRIG